MNEVLKSIQTTADQPIATGLSSTTTLDNGVTVIVHNYGTCGRYSARYMRADTFAADKRLIRQLIVHEGMATFRNRAADGTWDGWTPADWGSSLRDVVHTVPRH